MTSQHDPVTAAVLAAYDALTWRDALKNANNAVKHAGPGESRTRSRLDDPVKP
jgi:hypothetical protein